MGVVTKLFLSNRSQAVRIPAQLGLPDYVRDVEVRACVQERIISLVGQCWDTLFQQSPAVPDVFLAERATQEQPEREAV